MPTKEEIHQCEEFTKHTEIGTTGKCLCGFKKYKPQDTSPARCPFCNQLPEKSMERTDAGEYQVFCAMEGCAAFSNMVPLELWNQRAPHEQKVMRIPSEEPIFVLRAQDALALAPVYFWVDAAEKKKVPEEKLNSALAEANAMQAWQNAHGNKMPD